MRRNRRTDQSLSGVPLRWQADGCGSRGGAAPAGRRRTSYRAAIACAVILLLAGALAAPAQAADAVTLKAEAPAGGSYKPGRWLPIVVDIENNGEEVADSITVEQGRPPAVVRYERPIRLPAGARQRHLLLVRVDSLRHALPVRFRGARVDVPIRELAADDRLVLSLSDDRSALAFLSGMKLGPPRQPSYAPRVFTSPRRRSRRAPVYPTSTGQAPEAVVGHTDAAGFYDVPGALDSVDVVVLGNTSLRKLAPAQRAALKEWVERGGTLVVNGGSDVGRLADPLLQELLPVEGAVPQRLPSLDSLAGRWGGEMPVGEAVVAAGRPRPGAAVLVSQGAVPLVVTRLFGNGRVTFLAFDCNQEPVRNWRGQERLWRELLAAPAVRLVVPALADPGPLTRGGGALARAVANVPAMDLPRLRVILAFFLAYILCLVPLNHLLLRRFDRREYAWATTIAIVGVFCVVAMGIGYGLRGGRVLLYRCDVLESAPLSATATGVSTLGLFSPRRATYGLEAPGSLQEAGMDSGSLYAARGGGYSLVEGESTRIPNLEMNMWAMRVFSTPARKDLGGTVTASIEDGDGGPALRVENGTRQAFEGAEVFVGDRMGSVGPLAPGQSARVRMGELLPQFRGFVFAEPPAKDAAGRIRRAALRVIRERLLGTVRRNEPVLVAWGSPAENTVRVSGAHPQETAVGLYVIHLPPTKAEGRK